MADEVVLPIRATCCGMAGRPGHAASGADGVGDGARRRRSSPDRATTRYLCSNRTCEIGLQEATGEAYESFIFLLERITRP